MAKRKRNTKASAKRKKPSQAKQKRPTKTKAKTKRKLQPEHDKAPRVERLTVKSLAQLTAEEQKRERKARAKKFGKPGKRIAKRDVPKVAKLVRPRVPKDRKKRNVYGFTATIQARGEGSQPGREILVTKRGIFESPSGINSPRSFDTAIKQLPEFIARLNRRYQGRLTPIRIKVDTINKRIGTHAKAKSVRKSRGKK